MIVTVTMNPAIDKTVQLNTFVHGGLNRIAHSISDAGGKGINVSKTIKELGGETIVTGFCGGNNGKVLEKLLADFGMKADFVMIEGETRINTKVAEADGTLTELNEAGPCISEAEQKQLEEKLLSYAREGTWFVLAGSVPAGVPKTCYRDLIYKIHEKGGQVFLDADGDLFMYALEAGPDAIKPNRVELEKYVQKEDLSQEELVQIGQQFVTQGITNVIISLGGEGAIFLNKETELVCPAVKVSVRSTVGAGDAVVAAFTYGMSEGYPFAECAKLAMATSAGAVATEGTKPPTRQEVDSLMGFVTV